MTTICVTAMPVGLRRSGLAYESEGGQRLEAVVQGSFRNVSGNSR